MRYRFDEIAYNSTAKKKPTEDDKETYIGLEHLDSECLTISRWGSEVAPVGEKLIMKKGDILFGKRRAYQRKVGIAPFDGIFSAHGMVLRPNEEVINPNFFPFFISSDQFMERAVRISVGGLSPTINWKDLREQKFDIPSLDEQKELADKLWAAYNLKESYKKLLFATDEMVKSQFIEMFGDPMTNSKGWVEYGKINQYAQIVLGSTPNSKEASYWDGDIKWITPAEMTEESYYIYDTDRHITEDGVKSASLTLLPYRSVLFSTRAPIGKVGLVGSPMYCNQGFKNFICGDKLNPVYLYYTLIYKREYLVSLGTGTTFKELSKRTVEGLDIAIPPLSLQEQFENIYHQADKSKFTSLKSQFIEMFGEPYPHEAWENCLTITNGKKYPDEYLETGAYPICGSGGIMGYGDHKLCSKNTTILGRKGNINSPIYMDTDYWIVDTAFSLDVDCEKLHPKYFYYWCILFDFTKYNKQGVLPSLTKNDLLKIEMPIPPLDKQIEFVQILEQADKSKYIN